MARKVTRYETEDGELFENRADAVYHENHFRSLATLKTEIDKITVHGNVDVDELIDGFSNADSLLHLAAKAFFAGQR